MASSGFQWLLVAGLAGSAAVAAVVASIVARPSPGGATVELAPEHGLAERVAALEARLKSLEERPARSVFQPSPQPAPEMVAGTSARPAAAEAPAAVVDDPVFEAAVRDVVQRLTEEQESERQVQREEQRRLVAERWAADLSQPLRLTDAQKQKLQEIARAYFEALRDAGNTDGGAPPSPRERREQARALRGEYEGRIGQVLDGRQFADYQKLDEELKLGTRPRWGRGADR